VAHDDGPGDGAGDGFDDDFGDDGFDDDLVAVPLDDREIELVERDLADLESIEATFRPEGYRGVAIWCQDCAEEHLYPWDMLRENLSVLIETGETPVHEPAYAPEPDRYIPWEYARGFVDALEQHGLNRRVDVTICPRCRFDLGEDLGGANFCPRCGEPLLRGRLRVSLLERGIAEEDIDAILAAAGLPD
jgi:hypothetical protein